MAAATWLRVHAHYRAEAIDSARNIDIGETLKKHIKRTEGELMQSTGEHCFSRNQPSLLIFRE